jgi:hypothetical protein
MGLFFTLNCEYSKMLISLIFAKELQMRIILLISSLLLFTGHTKEATEVPNCPREFQVKDADGNVRCGGLDVKAMEKSIKGKR